MTDHDAMQLALAEAQQAAAAGEVPVGAVILKNGVLLATGRNAPINGHDPTAHAEIVALRAAAHVLGNYRLEGCELFVTLEPCTMCSGAMLHARLKRVVYGAADSKTGAAGSVLNVFAHPLLNHQTQVESGVRAGECLALLQEFFQQKRALQRQARPYRLRDDALRTPDARFSDLEGYPWEPRYVADLPSLGGFRMHYLDEGSRQAARTFFFLHDQSAWSFQYRRMLTVFLAVGHRIVAPDLPGFGRSDKPKKEGCHVLDWHWQVLLELIDRLELQSVVLVLAHRDNLLYWPLPMQAPDLFCGLVVVNFAGDAVSPEQHKAYIAPFPDQGYQAALRAFANLESEVILSAEVQQYWKTQWSGPILQGNGASEWKALAQRAASYFNSQETPPN